MRLFAFFLGLILVSGGASHNNLLTAATDDLMLVALGDSTTAGTPAFRSPAENPPDGAGDIKSQYAYWVMKRHPHWRVINRGVNGERSDQILRRVDPDVVLLRPDIVIVLAGVNDLYQGYSVESIQNHLKQIYERARSAGIRVMVCSLLPYNFSSPEVQENMRRLNAWIRDYSFQNGFGFCDTYHALEDPQQAGKLLSSSDGLHPDVEGYREMGEAIADALEVWLEKKAAS